MTLFESLEKQLDELNIFRYLSDKTFFNYLEIKIPDLRTPSGIIFPIKHDFESYQQFYYKSILLLGYSYFEVFLDNIIQSCQNTNSNLKQNVPKSYDCKVVRILDLKLSYSDQNNVVKMVSLIRNCFMHNNGKVNKSLSDKFPEYKINDKIHLDFKQLDDFGIEGRKIGKELYESAVVEYNLPP